MLIAEYDQWIESKIKSLKEAAEGGETAKFQCGQCLGDGEITDYGEITGQEFEATCNECDGHGYVDFHADDIDKKTAQALLPVRDYIKEVLRDLRQLARYVGRPEWVVLMESGWTVYSEIETQKMVIEIRKHSHWYKETIEAVH